MSKPLIIYIGGLPGMGKTSYMAQIAREFGIGIALSGDYLREFVKQNVPKDGRYGILDYSVYDAWKAFGEKNDENIIKGYIKQGEVFNNGIDALVERAKKNGESVIIESLYFIPEQIKSLKDPDVIKFYIHISDKDTYKKRLGERAAYTHPNSPGDRLIKEIDIYMRIMDHSVKAAKSHGIKTFDNVDYTKTRDEIMKYIKENQ